MTIAEIDNAIPESVRLAAENAKELEDQMDREAAGAPPPDPMETPDIKEGQGLTLPPADAPPTPAPVHARPAKSLAQMAGVKTAASQLPPPVVPAAPAPVAAAPTPGATAATDMATLQAENRKLQQQYATLQGKLYSEVPAQAETIRDLKATLAQNNAEMAELREMVKGSQSPDWKKNLNEDELAEYETPEDALGTSGKVAVAVADSRRKKELDEIRANQNEFNEKLDKSMAAQEANAASASEQTFWHKVDGLCSNASVINETDEFKLFVKTPDPITGLTYLQRAKAAMDDNNFEGVAKVFREYKTLTGMTEDIDGQVEIQIKPESTAATVQPKGEDEAPIVYRSQINQFQKDCMTGEYGPDPEANSDAMAIQDVIESAAMANRIVEDG